MRGRRLGVERGGRGRGGRRKDLGRRGSLLPFFYSFPFPFLRLPRRLADIIGLILISHDQCCYPRLILIFLPDIINLNLIYRYPTFIVVSALSNITRNFSNDDGDGQRGYKKSHGFIKQNSNSARMCNWHTLFVHFFSVSHCITASQDVLWRT